MRKFVDTEAGSVTIQYDDDQTETFRLDDLSENMQRRLALHGLSQKLGDAYSGAKEACADGRDRSEWARSQVAPVWEALRSDIFRRGGGAGIGDLPVALSQLTGRPVDEIVAELAKLDKKALKKLRASPAVKKKLLEVKLERLQKKAESGGDEIDLDGILG